MLYPSELMVHGVRRIRFFAPVYYNTAFRPLQVLFRFFGKCGIKLEKIKFKAEIMVLYKRNSNKNGFFH